MKRNRFTEEQIIGILKEHEAGITVGDLSRKHGVSIYKWKAKFGGMDVSEAKRLRSLENENMSDIHANLVIISQTRTNWLSPLLFEVPFSQWRVDLLLSKMALMVIDPRCQCFPFSRRIAHWCPPRSCPKFRNGSNVGSVLVQ